MPWWNGVLYSTGGITGSKLQQPVTLDIGRKFKSSMITHAVLGVSRITHTADSQNWQCSIYGRLGGATLLIADLAGISHNNAAVEAIPMLTADGTTQTRMLGFPIPFSISFIGNSAGVGLTYSASVVASFYAPE